VISVLAAPGTVLPGVGVVLDADELHHLRVRRIGAGETVRVLDGAGARAMGTLEMIGRELVVQVTSVEQVERPAELVLAVGAGDKERFARLAEQCTELGVTHLVPLDTERSRHVESRIRDSHLDKLRRRSREACKQCANPWATIIEPFAPLEIIAQRHPQLRWFLADPGGQAMPALGPDERVAWAIGPEGGFTASELALLRGTLHAERVWLGPHILRFESAAVAGAALTLDRRTSGVGDR
jgi:16S rRNA (uracil1498-N3)-methyltransferase